MFAKSRMKMALVPGFSNLSYEDRLRKLNIPTLEYRRRRGRMIEVYKILNECYDSKATEGLFELNERETRGNPYQLKTKKPRLEIRKNFFYYRCSSGLEFIARNSCAL